MKQVLLPLSFKSALTYSVPEGVDIKDGDFVEVPLGSKKIKGVVWGDSDAQISAEKIKPIIRRLPVPPLSKSLRKFIDWVAEYTLSEAGSVLKMAMNIDEALEHETLIDAYELTDNLPTKLTQSRRLILELLAKEQPLTAKEIQEETGVGVSVIKSLESFGAIHKTKIEPRRDTPQISKLDIDFSEYQQKAVYDLCAKVVAHKYSATVLDGVTGSGKTEVFFASVEEAFKNDDTQVLIMLPEIALTTQIVARFEKKFGFSPTQWHSGLSKKQREKNWRDISTGRARLIIGARSALFLPYADLRLIVVDEEHDGSYKQEDGVIYQARDMAVVRASIENIPIVLASATPSIETVENVRAGKYSCLKLPSRHGGAVMPDIKIIDMRKQKLKSGMWLSDFLKKNLADNMAAGKQSLLFLNRRGYAPLTLCRECGCRFKCPDCSSWLVEHKSLNRLLCHHCGYTRHIPKECPECQKEGALVSCGPGVERVAEEVLSSFPNARISIMTGDKMTTANKADDMISQISDGSVDIIVGTQVIAKGYHFPNLTLVGVVDADLGMEGGDLRAAERTYQLLQQVAGRAGREKDRGMVIMQSYMPENTVMRSLASGDRDAFISGESSSRKDTNMPPYVRLAGIVVSGHKEREVAVLARAIVAAAPVHGGVQIFGPVPAPMYQLRGKFRQRILVRAPRNINIQKWLRSLIAGVYVPSTVKVKVDIDPYSFM